MIGFALPFERNPDYPPCLLLFLNTRVMTYNPVFVPGPIQPRRASCSPGCSGTATGSRVYQPEVWRWRSKGHFTI